MTPAPHRAVRTAVVAAIATLGLLATATSASAEDGLTVDGDTTYALSTAGAVRATVTLDLVNVTPNRDAGGGSFYYYFYNGYSLPVPGGATNLRATSRGSSLTVSTKATSDPGTRLARISFPNLMYRQSRRIVLTYDVRGAAHRAKDSTRVGPGYASFVVYGPGDPGSSTLTVRAPSSYDFSSTTDAFSNETAGGRSTYTISDVTDGGPGIWAVVSLRDPKKVAERTVKVGDLTLGLSAFPDDPKWSSFVGATVAKGIPTLEKLTGTPWPGGLKTIREDSSPQVRGYDGWFDPSEDEIVVGERLDDDLVYHELSHAWFYGDRFVERWLSEGLAQVTAERAVRATKGTVQKHPVVTRSQKGAIALQSWQDDADGRGAAVNDYAYPAAYQAMTQLLGRLSDEQFAAVVAAGIHGERAYDPVGVATGSAGRTTTTDWLDLVETRAGVKNAPDVFARWVLTPEQKAKLPARASARTAYAAIDAADGAWLPPEGLRDAMSGWDFTRAATVRSAVTALGPAAVRVQDAARRAGLPVPASVRSGYEGAFETAQFTKAAATLPEAARTLDAVGAARRVARADRDPFTALGAAVLGVDATERGSEHRLAEGNLTRARSLATEVTDRSGWLLAVGIGLPLLALVLLAGLVLGGRAVVRRRRARRVLLDPAGAVVSGEVVPPASAPTPRAADADAEPDALSRPGG
ncbi:hypothetical protein [Phycicoccus sp.]|uniref:hypothetical protein n=1 Tax=Phycicoccus sp. TaxID=1902410 RepID=UPI002CFAEBE7|nr:hypothetical protein [Phycicoccus sp.]HMM96924.1 hypothetical protein [Phycicoccus sp.]